MTFSDVSYCPCGQPGTIDGIHVTLCSSCASECHSCHCSAPKGRRYCATCEADRFVVEAVSPVSRSRTTVGIFATYSAAQSAAVAYQSAHPLAELHICDSFNARPGPLLAWEGINWIRASHTTRLLNAAAMAAALASTSGGASEIAVAS